MTTSIKLTNINKYFGQGIAKVHVLKDLNFSAQAGELILILGPSGSGKSTFLTIAGGLQTPTSGKLLLKSKKSPTLKVNSVNNFVLIKLVSSYKPITWYHILP